MGPRAIARGNGLLRSAGEGRTSAIRKSDFPVGISHFPTGKSDFPLGISHFPISKSDFLIAGVARLGKVGNRWHPSFNGAARDRARKAAEP